ncbi:NH(3)-dependent NAD(+) synthetase [subsurface metagenome]
MPAFEQILAIDARSECAKIERYIQELFKSKASKCILIGLSGGIDSAVLASLAVKAVGANKIYAYYLYDRDSSRASKAKAKLISEWLGIELRYEDITAAMRKKKIYSPLIMRVLSFSAFLNSRLNRLLRRGDAFLFTLSRGNFTSSKIKRFLYNRTIGRIEAAFNARHIYRRQFLEEKSRQENWLILGAANRSEFLTGWFVKGGIDDLPYSPIIGLYKTQVLELARYLELPREIQLQIPSPDMATVLTDDGTIVIKYGTLDIILHFIETGAPDEEIISRGIRREDLRLVRTMNNLSEWKGSPENTEPAEEKEKR